MLPRLIRPRFRTTPQNNRIIHYVAILPFILPLILAVLFTLYVTINFEINAHRAKFPENEQYTEIGQWGPYVVSILVFAATLMARIRGWDFDTKGTDGQNRGFQWLFIGNSSTDESEERSRLMQPDPEPPIQLQVRHIAQ